MSYWRQAMHRPDTTRDDIAEGIKKCGYMVWPDGQVDLQVRHPTWIANVFVKLECKTPNRKDGFKPRKDQPDQTNYCAAHGIPYVFSAEDAIKYLQMRGVRLQEQQL